MIERVMAECRNYFQFGYRDGSYTIKDGMLSPTDGITSGMLVKITGSTFHDGVFRLMDGKLEGYEGFDIDEHFTGRVWLLNPPADFLQLVEQVKQFEKTRPASPVASETFGAYSHTMLTGSSGVLTWQEAFAQQLTPYRRMFTEVG